MTTDRTDDKKRKKISLKRRERSEKKKILKSQKA
jgi:hypothetical protein